MRLVGTESGTVSPALRFVRFRSREQAQGWVVAADARAISQNPIAHPLTRWEVIDTRKATDG